MENPVAITVNQVSKKFGHDKDQVIALDNVSVEIRENEFFTLLPLGLWQNHFVTLDRRV